MASTVELIVEITMQIFIGVLVYLFWTGYRQSRTRPTLVMAIIFTFIFFYHLIAALYLADIRGIGFEDPWEPHHLILFLTFGLLTYIFLSQRAQGVRLRSTTFRSTRSPDQTRKAG